MLMMIMMMMLPMMMPMMKPMPTNRSEYTECKYGGPLGRPGSSCAKARLVRPQEFCFDCASWRLSRSIWLASSCCGPDRHQKGDSTLAGTTFTFRDLFTTKVKDSCHSARR